MSNALKIVLPLLGISKDDISESTGFIDAYTDDINRPSLDNHIFLMYDWSKLTPEGVHVFYKFQKLGNLWGKKIIYIKGKARMVYTFIGNKQISSIIDGAGYLSQDNKLSVLQFWGFGDQWIRSHVMSGTITTNPERSFIPEEDYLPDDDFE